MRILLIFVVIFVALSFGILIQHDPGYALFAYHNWTLEMPLWLTIIGLGIIAVIFYFLLRFFNLLFTGPERIHLWWSYRQKELARLKTSQGLLELTEGRYKKAEKYLLRGAAHSDIPVVNYLSAAKAAEEEGKPERRDKYLEMALNEGAGSEIAVKITEAQLQLQGGEFTQSAKTLMALHQKMPHNPKVLKLLCTIFQALQDWDSLYPLLPVLRKDKILSETALIKLERQVIAEKLSFWIKNDCRDLTLQSLNQFWKHTPKSVWQDPTAVALYARALLIFNDNEAAEKIVRKTLNQQWDDMLVKVYGEIPQASLSKAMGVMEHWLKVHPDNAALLYSLGTVAFRGKLWGKSRDYLEQSLEIKPTKEGYRQLGELYDRINEQRLKHECFEKGLMLATAGEFRIQNDLS